MYQAAQFRERKQVEAQRKHEQLNNKSETKITRNALNKIGVRDFGSPFHLLQPRPRTKQRQHQNHQRERRRNIQQSCCLANAYHDCNGNSHIHCNHNNKNGSDNNTRAFTCEAPPTPPPSPPTAAAPPARPAAAGPAVEASVAAEIFLRIANASCVETLSSSLTQKQ